MGQSASLMAVLIEKFAKVGAQHPAILELAPPPSAVANVAPTGITLVMKHLPFTLRRARKLGMKDPRFDASDPERCRWVVAVKFEKKAGASHPYKMDVLLSLHRDQDPNKSEQVKHRVTVLARAMVQKTLGEDVGLQWRDGEGFVHTKSGTAVKLGFEAVSQQ